MKLEVVPKGVLDAGELKRVLREVRRGDAVLAPEGSNPDLAIAIIEQSLALRIPAVFGTALWVGYGGLMSYGPDYYAQGVQAAALVAKILRGRPASGPARRRRREDRPRGEPQDRGPPRPHRAAQDPAPRRRLPAMKIPTLARAALPQVRRRPARPGRRRADGVEPGRALLLLPGDPARDRPGRAREGGGGGRRDRAVSEGDRAAGARDDPDRVRRSRREPGGTGQARLSPGSGRGDGGAARARLPPGPSQRPRRQRAEPSRPLRQGAASRLSPGPGCRRQPGGLLQGAQVRRGARRARRTGVPSTSRTSPSRT